MNLTSACGTISNSSPLIYRNEMINISKSLDGYFLLLLLYIKRTTLHLSYYCNIDIAKWTFIYCRLLCLITVYLTLGIAIQIFVRKASGKERIPNYSFWVSFPGLVKVGWLCVLLCPTGKDKCAKIICTPGHQKVLMLSVQT